MFVWTVDRYSDGSIVRRSTVISLVRIGLTLSRRLLHVGESLGLSQIKHIY
jgi:hypothetical protein